MRKPAAGAKRQGDLDARGRARAHGKGSARQREQLCIYNGSRAFGVILEAAPARLAVAGASATAICVPTAALATGLARAVLQRRRGRAALAIAVRLEACSRLRLVTIARREHCIRALVRADGPSLSIAIYVLTAREVREHWETADWKPVVPESDG